MEFNQSEAERFLELLGKNGASRLRAFWPKHQPIPEGTPRAFRAPFSSAASEAASWVRRGLGVYVVIGNGGDSDDSITDCPALFIEWDDRPKAEQLDAWRSYGLPEPSFSVDTGGKSIHLYWVLNDPISPDRFRDLIARLISHTGADSTNRNPSRVMRLPGAWHFSWDKDNRKPQRNGQTTIVQASGMRYDADLFDNLLPRLTTSAPSAGRTPIELHDLSGSGGSSDDFPPRPIEQLYDAMQMVPEFQHGQGRYEELLKLAKRLEVELGRDDALQLLRSHSPHVKDIESYFATSPTKIAKGSIWPFLRDNYGVDIRRHDLKGRPRETGTPAAARPGAGDVSDDDLPDRSPALQAGINTSADLQQKPKRRTLAPDEVVASLPQRLGGIPRLNLRTNNFHAGGKTYTADDIARIYVHLSSETERWPKETTADVFVELSRDRVFDPVEEELNHIAKTIEPLPLDQWHRLDRHLLGIEDPIAADFLPQFLVSAVARVFRPGCGVRRSPVLIGPQWRGKTRLGRILFGSDHWIENVSDLGKDDLLRLQAGWGIELSELNGITRRKDQEALKAFLTANDDVFRTPYGKGVARYQRRCVFWGTSNGPPLRDLSGSTRFVCMKIPDRMLPLDWAVEHRDALWARAIAIYRDMPLDQEPWDHSTEEQRRAIEERNSNHQEIDPWSDEIAHILSISAERPVTIPHVLDRLDIPKSQRNNAVAARVRQLAEACGWVMERRWVDSAAGRSRKQGFWPVEPFSASLGHTDHTVDTPRCVQEKPSPPQGFDDPDHTGHTISTKVGNEEREDGSSAGGASRTIVGTFGVSGMSKPPDSLPRSASELPQRPAAGVSTGPSRYVHGSEPEDDDYDEFAEPGDELPWDLT